MRSERGCCAPRMRRRMPHGSAPIAARPGVTGHPSVAIVSRSARLTGNPPPARPHMVCIWPMRAAVSSSTGMTIPCCWKTKSSARHPTVNRQISPQHREMQTAISSPHGPETARTVILLSDRALGVISPTAIDKSYCRGRLSSAGRASHS